MTPNSKSGGPVSPEPFYLQILLEPGPLALFSALDGLGERNALAIEASFSLILELIFRQIHHVPTPHPS